MKRQVSKNGKDGVNMVGERACEPRRRRLRLRRSRIWTSCRFVRLLVECV